jgi:L-iditol 2-dehydrogenase
MKALRLHGAHDLRLHDEPPPVVAPGEVRLRVTAVGLCGSDRHWFEEGGIGDAVLAAPLVLGHEFVGVIEDGVRAGERVAVDPAIPCGRCAACLAGNTHLCQRVRFAGHGSTDGALRSRLAWPAELVHPLPESISDVTGALLEPLGVALHALDLGHVEQGTTACVIGCGPIGLLLIQALQAAGAETVAATDVLPHRLDAAIALGATPFDDAGGLDVDVAFEAAGEDAAVDAAIAAARPGGRVVIVGIPASDRTSFTASAARRKGLTLLLSRRMKADDLPRAIRLVESGRVAPASLVTARYPIEEFDDAFAELDERRGLKVVIEP